MLGEVRNCGGIPAKTNSLDKQGQREVTALRFEKSRRNSLARAKPWGVEVEVFPSRRGEKDQFADWPLPA